MSAQMLSFTRDVTPRQVERAMSTAVMAVLRDAREARVSTGNDDDYIEAVRHAQSMASAYSDLAAQLGIAVPESIERWLGYFDALDRLAAL